MNWAGPKAAAAPADSVRWRPRRRVAAAIAVGGAILAVAWLVKGLHAFDPRIAWALLAGCVAALATALGAVPVFAWTTPSSRWRDAMLGFGTGIMLAASFFSLIVPALAAAAALGAAARAASLQVAAGVVLGAAALWLLDRRVQGGSLASRAGAASSGTQGGALAHGAAERALLRAWLFVAAITLHNFPEGLAIGVAFAGPDAYAAAALAAGISIQDIPEGLAVALALRSVGYDRARSVGFGALSGLCEPIAAVLAAAVVSLSARLLPWGLSFAAGAMLYVIALHMLPESWRNGHRRTVSIALAIGFALMTALDTMLA